MRPCPAPLARHHQARLLARYGALYQDGGSCTSSIPPQAGSTSSTSIRGETANRRVLIETHPQEGRPNGLTVDAEGIWCAMWDGWAIRRYTPDGGLDAVVRLPVPRPSSCIFGGDDVTTPYVMAGRIRLLAKHLAEAPLSDSLFAFRPGVPGLPAATFAG